MKQLIKYTKEYFEKFSKKPVEIKLFDPQSKVLAREYIQKLRKLLEKWNLKPLHRGSTALGIAGKGEIEIGIYLNDQKWQKVVDFLKNYNAKIDQKLNAYLSSHCETLDEYENTKRKYAFSKREYMWQKHLFFKKIIEQLPED